MDLGKRCIKTISKMTHLSFIFVFGITQPSPIAFPMLPCIGKAHPRVVSRLRQSKHRQSIVSIVATSISRTQGMVLASVCVAVKRRRRSDVNTHLMSDEETKIGGGGRA